MKTKETKEKATPMRCVCKKDPIMVKMRGRYMYTCPDHLNCAVRGNWFGKEQDAIKSWNIAVQEARQKRRK